MNLSGAMAPCTRIICQNADTETLCKALLNWKRPGWLLHALGSAAHPAS